MTDVLNGTELQGTGPDGTAPAQERRLVTEIPGPRSRALMERRTAAVSAGVGGTLPVFVERAGGGVIVDVDGNSLIDLGSGIAVVSVGNAAPRVVAAVQEQVAAFTHTCFMVTPYEGYVAVCEELARLTPGDHAKRSALFNSGSEAVENAVKIARLATGRQADRRLRPRLSRPDQPHDGADGEEHALQAPVRALRARDLPRADVLSVPRRAGPDRRRGRRPRAAARGDAGGRGQRGRRADRADPGRGRLRRPRGRVPARHRRLVPRLGGGLHRRRDPDRVLPHRRLVRLRRRGRRPRPDHHGQGHGRRDAAGRRDRPGGAHGRRPRRRARRHLRREPGRLRRVPGHHRDDGGARPRPPRRGPSRRRCCPGCGPCRSAPA